jgi:RNA polymerase sigma-70 factor (ECF subfamily)
MSAGKIYLASRIRRTRSAQVSEAQDLTPVSLLEQLNAPAAPSSESAWRRFVQLYSPLLFLWARRVGASEGEAPDLVQEVFLVLAREMPRFHHNHRQSFRGWLWTVLRNRWRDRLRQLAAQPSLATPQMLETVAIEDNVQETAEKEYRAYLIARALGLMRAELPEREWGICQEYLVKGRAAVEVARELTVTVNQVYLAKSRILRRLRRLLEGLLD